MARIVGTDDEVEKFRPTETEELPAMTPWLTMWFFPRRTLRYILETDEELWIHRLAIFAGFSILLNPELLHRIGYDGFTTAYYYVNVLIMGAMLGEACLWLSAWVAAPLGKLLGGKGHAIDLRVAWAWANLPNALFFILGLPFLLLMNDSYFMGEESLRQNFAVQLGIWVYGGLGSVLQLWALFLYWRAVAEAHEFGWFRALLPTLGGAGMALGTIISIGWFAITRYL